MPANLELTTIYTYWIFFRQMQRLRIRRGEFIRLIYIYRESVTLHLPVARDLYGAPFRRQPGLIICILEIPFSVQTHI